MPTLRAMPRDLAGWLEWQQRLHPRTIDMGLARVRRVARQMGLLPLPGRTAIVGGTNGKGSTSAMLAAICRAHGLRTGRYASPHLVHYAERIAVGDARGEQPASEAELVCAFAAVEAARDGEPLTYFEFGTLAALWLFRAAGCQAQVLEVGLGGRLDATNIVDAQVAVLCSVGMDHMDWLGDTLGQIGAEKAGIFRTGQAVVLGEAGLPRSVHERLAVLRVPPAVAGEDFHWQRHEAHWDWREGKLRLEGLAPPALSGGIQYRNAANAIAAARRLLAPRPLDPRAVSGALASVRLPGRLQQVPGEVEWLLDVAHNAPAAAVLAAELAARPRPGRTIVVLGMLADKQVGEVAAALAPVADEWIACGIREPRGLDAESLAVRLAPRVRVAALVEDVAAGCALARERARPGDRVVVCGSFHAVGPALRWLGLY